MHLSRRDLSFDLPCLLPSLQMGKVLLRLLLELDGRHVR